jgi:hypothetical protein
MSLSEPATNQLILCIDLKTDPRVDQLFCEMIQQVENRPFYWVRPLVLKIHRDASVSESSSFMDEEHYTIYDVRQSADLILPRSLFRLAIDIEVLPLIAQLYGQKHDIICDRPANDQLHRFVRSLWQAFPECFTEA